MSTDAPRCPGGEERSTAGRRRGACVGSRPRSPPWGDGAELGQQQILPLLSRALSPFQTQQRACPSPAGERTLLPLVLSQHLSHPPSALTIARTRDVKRGSRGGCAHLWIPARRCLCVRDIRTLPPQAACGAGGTVWVLASVLPALPPGPKSHSHPRATRVRGAGKRQQLHPGGQRPLARWCQRWH